MNEEEWDGKAFRSRMVLRAEGHDRYIEEQRDRIRRGQSNGSKFTHDRWLGEWWVYYRLAGLMVSETRAGLVKELENIAAHYPGIAGVFDEESARSGYIMAIRGLLSELGEEMPGD